MYDSSVLLYSKSKTDWSSKIDKNPQSSSFSKIFRLSLSKLRSKSHIRFRAIKTCTFELSAMKSTDIWRLGKLSLIELIKLSQGPKFISSKSKRPFKVDFFIPKVSLLTKSLIFTSNQSTWYSLQSGDKTNISGQSETNQERINCNKKLCIMKTNNL